jgi:hypothetical protein
MKKFLFVFLLAIFLSAIPILTRAATISPVLFDLAMDPGQAGQENLILYNETNQEIKLTGYVEAFQPKGEDGLAQIYKPDINYQAVSWITFGTDVLILKPGDIKAVPVKIAVPKTAEIGGYFLALMWESAPAKANNNGVAISSRVGALMLLRVNGDLNEKLGIASFNLSGEKKFYNRLPVAFTARISNGGNIHIKPTGAIMITNIFGQVAANTPFNAENKNVLPQSIRKIESVWQKNGGLATGGGFWAELKSEYKEFAFGRYSAQLNLEYGQARQRISTPKIYFWVVPWRLFLFVGALIIFIIIIVKIFFKKIRSKRYYRPKENI